MKSHFLDSFRNKYVFKWSLWWALATCGFIQCQTYMQPLWAAIQSDTDQALYNGATEAVLTLLGFIGALLAGVLNADWKRLGELVLAVFSIVAGTLMLVSSQTDNILVSYACYVGFGALYHFMITVVSSEIAQHIKEDSYGLVFGINTFLALAMHAILTAVVVTENVGFALGPRDQYLVYGFYHLGIAVIFILIGFIVWFRTRKELLKT